MNSCRSSLSINLQLGALYNIQISESFIERKSRCRTTFIGLLGKLIALGMKEFWARAQEVQTLRCKALLFKQGLFSAPAQEF